MGMVNSGRMNGLEQFFCRHLGLVMSCSRHGGTPRQKESLSLAAQCSVIPVELFQRQEQLLQEACVFGDDFGIGCHFHRQGKLLAIGRAQSVGEHHFHDILAFAVRNERDALNASFDHTEFILWKVVEIYIHLLSFLDATGTDSCHLQLTHQLRVAFGYHTEYGFPDLYILIGSPHIREE